MQGQRPEALGRADQHDVEAHCHQLQVAAVCPVAAGTLHALGHGQQLAPLRVPRRPDEADLAEAIPTLLHLVQAALTALGVAELRNQAEVGPKQFAEQASLVQSAESSEQSRLVCRRQ